MSLKVLGLRVLVVIAILLSGCGGPDYTPIGDGLKAIGICLVVYGVVAALTDLIKGEQNASERTETKSPRKRKSSNRKEDQP